MGETPDNGCALSPWFVPKPHQGDQGVPVREGCSWGERAQHSTLIYLRMNVMEMFHYGLLAFQNFFLYFAKTVMMLRNCYTGILFAQTENGHWVIQCMFSACFRLLIKKGSFSCIVIHLSDLMSLIFRLGLSLWSKSSNQFQGYLDNFIFSYISLSIFS